MLTNLTESHLFIAIVAISVAAQIGIVPFGGPFFRAVPLDLEICLRSVMVGASILLAGTILRAAGRLIDRARSAPALD